MTKKFTFKKGSRFGAPLAMCVTAGTLPFLCIQSTQAVEVDTEVLLLVDVSKGLSNSDFTLMTQGIADTFRSSAVLNSIQSGNQGSIAASLVFWSGNNKQQTAVAWVDISDSVSAEAFAVSIENSTRPWSNKKTALGDAIRDTTTYFGTETGGASNGFESSVQMVNVIGGSEDNNTPPGNDRSGAVAAARDTSLASGADIINGLAVTQDDPNIGAYYDNFVVGGSVGTTQGSTSVAANYSSLSSSFTPLLATTLSQAAATTVPEPSSGLFVFSTCALLFLRRR